MDRQVRTLKELKKARGAYILKSTDEQISQRMERIQVCKNPKGHLQTEEHR
jgi:hypothetical protein